MSAAPTAAFTRRLFVGVDIPSTGRDAGLVDLVVHAARIFDEAGADLLVVRDDYSPSGDLVAVDAPTLAAFAAPQTTRIAIAPVVSTTHTEPFHVAKAIQTLDIVAEGRAGWQASITTSARDAAAFGRREAPATADAWAEAEEAVEVARRLWDSWEDDAIIRDVDTGRFIDRDRVHHIDFEGRFFSIKGPSIVPRTVQGNPPVIVRVVPGDDAALNVAVRSADIVRVAPEEADRARAAAEDAGRTPAIVVDLDATTLGPDGVADVLAELTAGETDGAVLVFAELPAEPSAWSGAIAAVAASLPDGATLRERLGIPRLPSRYATADREDATR
ncbi:LLM class flavin-dependent oxidoreductase [Microbacterium sp. AZCO]|uniref:LLM class flavin-dependent oxidoreductase n=1 Tax=Microbacterium sp. AZCO TaxID=3142976 RepID=UPI0031F45647